MRGFLSIALLFVAACGDRSERFNVVLIVSDELLVGQADRLADGLGGGAFTEVWSPSMDAREADWALQRGVFPGSEVRPLTLAEIFSGEGYNTIRLSSAVVAPLGEDGFEVERARELPELALAARLQIGQSGDRPFFFYIRVADDGSMEEPVLTAGTLTQEVFSILSEADLTKRTLLVLAGLKGEGPAAEVFLCGPGVPHGLRSEETRTLMEVAPAVLRAAGLEPPAPMEAGLFELHGAGPLAEVFTKTDARVSVLAEGHWLLHRYAAGRTELFDLAQDPNQTEPLNLPARTAEMLARLDAQGL